jgi:hypothetical protein
MTGDMDGAAGTADQPAWLASTHAVSSKYESLQLSPSPMAFWPSDRPTLRKMAYMQCALGCVIIPLSLTFILADP